MYNKFTNMSHLLTPSQLKSLDGKRQIKTNNANKKAATLPLGTYGIILG